MRLTLRQVAERLSAERHGISENTVRGWLRLDPPLPATPSREDGVLRVEEADLEAWLGAGNPKPRGRRPAEALPSLGDEGAASAPCLSCRGEGIGGPASAREVGSLICADCQGSGLGEPPPQSGAV